MKEVVGKAQGKRYSIRLKREILAYAKNNGVGAAVRTYKKTGVTHQTVYNWLRAEEKAKSK